MKPTLLSGFCLTALLCVSVLEVRALNLEELSNDHKLTPQTFARHFADFKFVFRADVQAPQDFLASRAGDCDDYSTLAAAQLAARGYHPRLVSVRMNNIAHVICYVEEAKGFLDYNIRARGNGIVPCGPELADIAAAVAKSFKSKWTSASEFTYTDGTKRLVATKLAPGREPRVVASTASQSGPSKLN